MKIRFGYTTWRQREIGNLTFPISSISKACSQIMIVGDEWELPRQAAEHDVVKVGWHCCHNPCIQAKKKKGPSQTRLVWIFSSCKNSRCGLEFVCRDYCLKRRTVMKNMCQRIDCSFFCLHSWLFTNTHLVYGDLCASALCCSLRSMIEHLCVYVAMSSQQNTGFDYWCK